MAKRGQLREGPEDCELLGDISWNRNQTMGNQAFDTDHLSLTIRLLACYLFMYLDFLFRQGHTMNPKLVLTHSILQSLNPPAQSPEH